MEAPVRFPGVANITPNITQSLQHPFSVLLRVNKSSFHHVVPLSIAMGSKFCILHPRQPQQCLILCTHYLSNPCKGYVFLQSCDKTLQSSLVCTKYLPTCIPQFPQQHCSWGASQEFTYPPPSNGVSPHFTIELFCFLILYPLFLQQNPQNN